jgi:phage gp29-like protein
MSAIPTQNTQEQVTAARIRYAMMTRYNPIRGLTPELLGLQLEEYRMGGMRVTRTWDVIKDRWPILKSVAMKREKAAARVPWDVLIREDVPEARRPEAEQQRDVLKRFWNSVRATAVIDQNQQGGVRMLLRQMMEAIGHRHAVHEIVWKPNRAGVLSAEFRFCPLWFFESRTGKLRYLQSEGAIDGVELVPNKWLVTCGDGLMEACAVAYMYRDMPLKDWSAFSEKFGIPYIHGETSAKPGTAEWDAAATALENFGSDGALLTEPGVKITPLQVGSQGQATFEPAIKLQDAYAAILWRGGDLGTQSAGNSVGASLQGDESDSLLEDDCLMLAETLQEQVERVVLQYAFGPEVEPLAYFTLLLPKKKNVDLDIKVDQFLVGAGARISVREAMERYGRKEADAADEVLQRGSGGSQFGAAAADVASTAEVLGVLANEQDPRLIQEALSEVAAALSDRLAPLRQRIQVVLAETDLAKQRRLIDELRLDLPKYLPQDAADGLTRAFSRVLGAGVVGGF